MACSFDARRRFFFANEMARFIDAGIFPKEFGPECFVDRRRIAPMSRQIDPMSIIMGQLQ
jgi:hypothetical protein